MTQVMLSLGSNRERYRHITSALDALHQHFGELMISPVYESESVGFKGSAFLNLVVGIECECGLSELSQQLKQIEDDNGRDRTLPKFGPRTLDIDILTFGDLTGEVEGIELPRPEITENAFVLRPLADIQASNTLPGSELNYQQLWQQFDKSSQKLWPVDFEWRGEKISHAS